MRDVRHAGRLRLVRGMHRAYARRAGEGRSAVRPCAGRGGSKGGRESGWEIDPGISFLYNLLGKRRTQGTYNFRARAKSSLRRARYSARSPRPRAPAWTSSRAECVGVPRVERRHRLAPSRRRHRRNLNKKMFVVDSGSGTAVSYGVNAQKRALGAHARSSGQTTVRPDASLLRDAGLLGRAPPPAEGAPAGSVARPDLMLDDSGASPRRLRSLLPTTCARGERPRRPTAVPERARAAILSPADAIRRGRTPSDELAPRARAEGAHASCADEADPAAAAQSLGDAGPRRRARP